MWLTTQATLGEEWHAISGKRAQNDGLGFHPGIVAGKIEPTKLHSKIVVLLVPLTDRITDRMAAPPSTLGVDARVLVLLASH
jgi:hypothetical protein